MELVPFSVINEYLKQKLLHPSRYGSSKYSFLKVFQHGLYFHFTKQKQKIIFNYFGFPLRIQQFIYWIKSKKSADSSQRIQLKEFLILDPGRVVQDEEKQWRSIYFDQIVELIGRDKITIINQREDSKVPGDYMLRDFSRVTCALDQIELGLLREVNKAISSAHHSGQFATEEQRQIQSAMHIFFEEFRVYYNLLKGQPTKKILFICHYHNEGLIAAAKYLGIESIEFQHGLIASNDLYYVYHEQFASAISKAFFPEKIMVYGPYWKRILENGCEYHSYQIKVAGDYLFRLNKQTTDAINKENLIVVCAQKNMHDDYVAYVNVLMQHAAAYPDWKVVVKLHPLEKNKSAYYALNELGVEIRDIETPLDNLLKQCKIHISIYSTTFYDALGFDVCNYSVQEFGSMSDYAADMIAEGVALPLYTNENPISKYLTEHHTGQSQVPRNDVYSSFDRSVIREAIGLGS
jgi:hypothetical protein